MVDCVPDWKALIFKPAEKKLYVALISSHQVVEVGVTPLE